jgi:hypothetical protein
MQKRDLVVVDVELAAAVRRRKRHPDPLSKRGQEMTIDGLLDERLQLTSSGKTDK